MKFFKDTKMVKVKAYATGHNSGATAYGEAFIPYEDYLVDREVVNNLEISVDGLDGKHSYVECDVETEINSLGEFIVNSTDEDLSAQNIDELLYEELHYKLTNDNLTYNNIKKIVDEIQTRIEFANSEIILGRDTVIEGNKIPKGAVITFRITADKLPTEELFEI